MKKYIFFYTRELGYVIQEYCPGLASHRCSVQYNSVEAAQSGINQLIAN